jgi:two-component system heavy metal sensor histidine kinase CusS
MLFQRALSNLVANAVRYADEASQIILRAGMEENRQIIQVINQGPPIAQVHLEKLFERFYRADAARSSQRAGIVDRTRNYDSARR